MIYSMMDDTGQIEEIVDRKLLGLNTCIPGIIKSFDPTTQTASVQPAIQNKWMDWSGEVHFDDPVIIDNVPVSFPYATAKGYALTLPVSEGDSCILIFSQRMISNWKELGGIQPPEEDGSGCRNHSLADAIAILCAPSLVDTLSDWLEDGIEIRNATRSQRISLNGSGSIDTVTTSSISRFGGTTAGQKIVGELEVTGHAKIGSGDSGSFVDSLGKVIVVQDGIIVSGLSTKTPDTTPPTVNITSPSGGTVSGVVDIEISASDANEISKVVLKVDDAVYSITIDEPFKFRWNTSKYEIGSAHSLVAVAYDMMGNMAESDPISVTIGESA